MRSTHFGLWQTAEAEAHAAARAVWAAMMSRSPCSTALLQGLAEAASVKREIASGLFAEAMTEMEWRCDSLRYHGPATPGDSPPPRS